MIEIAVTEMTMTEAQEWKGRIGNAVNDLRILLAEGYERGAWKRLGYSNWTQCVKALAKEFGFSERRMWQLHSANKTELLLNPGSVGGEIPERHLRPLTSLEPEQQREVWAQAIGTAPVDKKGQPRITAAHVQEVADELTQRPRPASQPVEVTIFSHKSEEYYTPPEYIEAARGVMGKIDLDPASCKTAQEWIQATQFYTKEDDGLQRRWEGRCWLNPPYSKTDGKSNQATWSQKLISEYRSGRIIEAILLVKAALGYKWFEDFWCDFPVCFARERLSFIRADGSSDGQSKQGTAFFYFGDNAERFREVFSQFGRVIMPDD